MYPHQQIVNLIVQQLFVLFVIQTVTYFCFKNRNPQNVSIGLITNILFVIYCCFKFQQKFLTQCNCGDICWDLNFMKNVETRKEIAVFNLCWGLGLGLLQSIGKMQLDV
jgi:hypothetical protein